MVKGRELDIGMLLIFADTKQIRSLIPVELTQLRDNDKNIIESNNVA